jgi:hypothetical protein
MSANAANHRRSYRRKFILIAALVLASASAQAAGSRSLSRASNDEHVATRQPNAEVSKPVETPKAVEEAKPVETPKYVDRPAAVNTAAGTTKTDVVQPATVPAPKAARRKPPARLDRGTHHRRTASP